VHRVERLLFYTLLLVFVSSFFSITVYEGLLLVSIIISLGLFLFKRKNPIKSLFSIPLLGHISAITISSLLFLKVKEQFRKLLEQDIFTFSYFTVYALDEKKAKDLMKIFIKLSIILGLIFSIKVLYTYYTVKDFKGFWGGNFVIGNLLALPFFASLYCFFKQKKLYLKILFILLAILFLYTSFLPVERSIILGFLTGIFIFSIAILNFRKLLIFLFIFLLGGALIFSQSSKVKYWINILSSKHSLEEKINRFSSNRLVIAKGAIQLIDNAIKEGDYVKLLIGWGYGPQKQYKNLPKGFGYIDEYESFILITEFINGGLINVIFIVWFYIVLLYLTLKIIKEKDAYYLEKITLISALWVNMVYHIFTLFWVPINGLFYIFLGLVEVLSKKKSNK